MSIQVNTCQFQLFEVAKKVIVLSGSYSPQFLLQFKKKPDKKGEKYGNITDEIRHLIVTI